MRKNYVFGNHQNIKFLVYLIILILFISQYLMIENYQIIAKLSIHQKSLLIIYIK